jgi:polysaccharide biosynthesis protein PslH
MKVFVMLSRVPWPLEKGDKLRAFHQLKELTKEHEICLFCLSDSPVDNKAILELQQFCTEVHIERLGKAGIYFRLFRALFSKLPYQVHYFFKPSLKAKINQIIADFGTEHIYCQLIRCSEYVKNIHHIPKTIDYMDAFSKGVERRILQASFLSRPFFRAEARRLVEYENLIFDYFENKTIITEQDKRFIYHPDQNQIVVVPNGVDTSFFHPMEREKRYELVFNGNMNYPPNIDCVEYISRDVLPLLPTNTRFLISGASPSPAVQALGTIPGITVSGWVTDQRESYASGRIFIAPFRIGTGLQNKLLEAMAMGIPCITSTLANNALGARPGEEILVADSPREVAQAVGQLLGDHALYHKLSESGKQFVSKRFEWSSSTRILSDLIQGKSF